MTNQTLQQYDEYLDEFYKAKDAMEETLTKHLEALEQIKSLSLTEIIESRVLDDLPQDLEEAHEWIDHEIEFTNGRLAALEDL